MPSRASSWTKTTGFRPSTAAGGITGCLRHTPFRLVLQLAIQPAQLQELLVERHADKLMFGALSRHDVKILAVAS